MTNDVTNGFDEGEIMFRDKYFDKNKEKKLLCSSEKLIFPLQKAFGKLWRINGPIMF